MYQQLGQYEVLERIGAGGMGEVFRARDPRLGRDVAIKVLPPLYAINADRLQRFQQEARTAGMLNHPNLLTVFELGVHDGAPYIVTELLEGETLRARLEGGAAIAPRKVIDYAIQIASGLAAAHERGVVHRDLKPENLYITKDGRVKILDFGLAKLTAVASGELADVETMKREGTAPGTVMGTVGYMAPEQVRGQSVDHRADLFSLGAVLYEMLSGRRAFHAGSSVETMNAILKDDPPELSTSGRLIPPALQRIVEHCLEKSPEARFQSARDLAFHLEAISGSESGVSRALPAQSPRRRIVPIVAALLLALFAGGSAYIAARRAAPPSQPTLHQLSYMRGTVRSARFAPDGQTVIYGGAFDGAPLKMYQARVNGLESVPMAMPDGDILSIAPNGDLAVSLGRRFFAWASDGTLATGPLLGGAPRPLLEHVSCADWTPDGKELVVVRRVDHQDQLEWPMGKPLLHRDGYYSHLRVSPDGTRAAFLDHPIFDDNRGNVTMVDRTGKTTVLVRDWASIEGLAWSPDGSEVWFTGDRDGSDGQLELFGVDTKGRVRPIWRVPASLFLMDVARDGRVLLAASEGVGGHSFVGGPGDTRERDLTWLNTSWTGDLSADGKYVAIASYGAGSGQYYSVYLRPTDGGPAARLGEGEPFGFSSDNRWVLSIRYSEPPEVLLLPTGPGQPRKLDTKGMACVSAAWTPDGKVVVRTREHGTSKMWLADPGTGALREIPLTNLVVTNENFAVSPDGRWIFQPYGDTHFLLPLAGGAAQKAAGFEPEERFVRWIDGTAAFVCKKTSSSFRIDRLDLFTGQRTHVRDIPLPDLAGGLGVDVLLSQDGKTYVTSMMRLLTDLYVVEGVR